MRKALVSVRHPFKERVRMVPLASADVYQEAMPKFRTHQKMILCPDLFG